MCCIRSGPVYGVHLASQRVDRGFDEETRLTVASATPNDIRSETMIPLSDFGNDTLAFCGICQVGTDIVKSLFLDVLGGSLH